MELLYFKIFEKPGKELKICDVDFNLTGKYVFLVDNVSKEISFKINESYISNIYSEQTEITAIVGKNGLGKTTILKFLQYIICEINEKQNVHKSIFSWWKWCAIYSKENKLYYCESRLVPAENKKESFKQDVTLDDFEMYFDTYHIDHKEIKLDIDDAFLQRKSITTSIFYSPFFEFEEPKTDKIDYIDVSNDRLFYESKHLKEVDEQTLSQTLNFRREEIKRQITFIEKADGELDDEYQFYKDFIHNGITLAFNGLTKKFGSEPRYIAFDDIKLYNAIDKKYLQTYRSTRDYLTGKSLRDYEFFIARDSFYKRIIEILYYSFEYRPEPKANTKGEYRPKIQKIKITDIDLKKNFNELIKIFIENQSVISEKDKFKDLLNKALILIEKFISYDLSDDVFIYNLDDAKELLKIEKEILLLVPYNSEIPIFSFDWHNLSTGEKAYLNLFSRIYYGYEKLVKDEKFPGINTIYILIDEGSTGFHPQWQKEFLVRLIDFSQKAIPLKIHFIITSHSPYLLSDIQKEDVISIGQRENHKFHLQNTFGANIHELLSDSFYLENSFIGEFARGKITEIGDLLIDDIGLSEEKISYIESIINIIGEPIIKERLQFLLASKKKLKTKDQIIAELRSEIEKYKKN